MSVERFSTPSGYGRPEPHPDGEYVRYSDHERALRETEDIARTGAESHALFMEANAERNELRAAAEGLRRALEKIAHEAVDAPHCREIARAALSTTDGGET